jgi:hypothetical protein
VRPLIPIAVSNHTRPRKLLAFSLRTAP